VLLDDGYILNDEYIKQNGAEYENRTIIKTARSIVHKKIFTN